MVRSSMFVSCLGKNAHSSLKSVNKDINFIHALTISLVFLPLFKILSKSPR